MYAYCNNCSLQGYKDKDGNNIKDTTTEDGVNQTTASLNVTGQKVEVTNTYENDMVAVEVTKTFIGIETSQIPTNFQIKAKLGAGDESPEITLTLDGYTDTGSLPTGVTVEKATDSLTWTISGLPIGTVVTFTEENYTVAGYNVTSTVAVNSDESETGTSGSATAADPEGTVAFVNTYVAGVELPSTGGPGTVVYTVAGLSLMSVALWMLLRRKKQTT